MSKIPAWLWILGGLIVLTSFSTAGVIAVDYLTAAWMSSPNAQKWAPVFQSMETVYGLPEGLLARMAYQESHFLQNIIDGTQASSAGALGMMQLEPKYFNTVNRPIPFSDSDTQDQIDQAAHLLATLYAHFGDWTLSVAAYDAGESGIDHVLAGTEALPTETARYIASVSSDLPNIVNPTLTA